MTMRAKLIVVLFVTILSVEPLKAAHQNTGVIPTALKSMWVKAENGLLITWQRSNAKDSKSSSINIFDKQGHSLLSFDTLRFVPDATSVSIWDVSARPQQLVVVAATYARAQEVPPTAVLLYFDFKGTLLSAEALEPAREIAALALDDNLNVWTLTLGSGGKDPSSTPMVIEYDKNGETVRELLTRSLFPPHQRMLVADSTVGAEAAGYNAGTFWFWLAKSTDFVTIRTTDGAVLSRTQTGYPLVQGELVVPLQIASNSSALIAEVRIEGTDPTAHMPTKLGHFTWSPETKSWSAFDPDVCSQHRLVGMDGDQQMYIQFHSSTICSYSVR